MTQKTVKPKKSKSSKKKNVSQDKTDPKQTTDIESTQEKGEFLPVVLNGEKATDLPINALLEKGEFISNKVWDKHPTYFAVTVDNKDTAYFIKPKDFEKYILETGKVPRDADRVKKEVVSRLNDLKSAWIYFGSALISVNSPRLYKLWGFKTFEEYCEKELKIHFSTAYEIITSTLLLIRDKPELYEKLIDDKIKKKPDLPSYHSLVLLSRKRKKLEKLGKYDEVLTGLLENKTSSRQFKRELDEILGQEKKDQENPKNKVLKIGNQFIKSMQEAKLSESMIEKVKEILAQVK